MASLEPFSQLEALVGVAFCAVFADGTMEVEEDDRLSEYLADCRALRGCAEEDVRLAMTKAEAYARKHGEHALLAAAARSLQPPARETAFCLAADLVLADGEIAEEERGFIDRLRGALGVQESVASKVVEVLLIRNAA